MVDDEYTIEDDPAYKVGYAHALKCLSDNLEIEIVQRTEFGPTECIVVRLHFLGEEISKSSCSLPSEH
jgi:hypothetical protein